MPSLRNARQTAASDTPSAAASVPPSHPASPWRRRQFQLPQKAQTQPLPVFRFLARSRLIAQPGYAPGRKPLAPQANRVWPHPKFARDLVIPLTIQASKNDLGTLDQASFCAPAAGKVDQFGSLFGRTRQSHHDPGHQTPQMVCDLEASYIISRVNAIKH
jgi:hypothetical protein